MEYLKRRILREGRLQQGHFLSLDHFLTHRIDIDLMQQIGVEFHRRFADCQINKILTIESSGISVACLTAVQFGVPVLVAKKSRHPENYPPDFFRSKVKSYRHDMVYDILVSKRELTRDDRVLIVDDVLANGGAMSGLIDLVQISGATLVGAGIVIEKSFEPGGRLLRQRGVRVESLAKIAGVDEAGKIIFEE